MDYESRLKVLQEQRETYYKLAAERRAEWAAFIESRTTPRQIERKTIEALYPILCQEDGCLECKPPRAVRLDPNAVIQVELVEEVRPTHRATITIDFACTDAEDPQKAADHMLWSIRQGSSKIVVEGIAEVRKL